jgi:hypothetical protein
MRILDRYAAAVRSSCLTVDERTVMSDTDVLGAMGLAGRDLERGHDSAGNPIKPAPLAVALERLFAGDNRASMVIVQLLSDMAWQRARTMDVKLNRLGAADMAKACLAWHRDGVCKACGGHGTLLIRGTKTLGDQKCKKCEGAGRIPFEAEFDDPKQRSLAGWLVAEMQRAQSRAGPRAMDLLAPRREG